MEASSHLVVSGSVQALVVMVVVDLFHVVYCEGFGLIWGGFWCVCVYGGGWLAHKWSLGVS